MPAKEQATRGCSTRWAWRHDLLISMVEGWQRCYSHREEPRVLLFIRLQQWVPGSFQSYQGTYYMGTCFCSSFARAYSLQFFPPSSFPCLQSDHHWSNDPSNCFGGFQSKQTNIGKGWIWGILFLPQQGPGNQYPSRWLRRSLKSKALQRRRPGNFSIASSETTRRMPRRVGWAEEYTDMFSKKTPAWLGFIDAAWCCHAKWESSSFLR